MGDMEKGKLSIEKRKFPRVDLDVTVRFRRLSTPEEKEEAAGFQDAHTANLSQGGVQLMETMHLGKGDLLKLEIEVPDRQTAIKAYSEVMWIKPPDGEESQESAGIKFMGLKDEDEDFLAGLVERAVRKANGGEGATSRSRIDEDEFIKKMGKRFSGQ